MLVFKSYIVTNEYMDVHDTGTISSKMGRPTKIIVLVQGEPHGVHMVHHG